MALDIGLRLAQALNQIGIKMGSYIGKSSNVKKAMFGGKPTFFKPRALETVRGTGGNFDDALKLIEEEAQFIVNATDAEKMNFLNNVNDYKEFGGPPKRSGILNTDEAKNLTNETEDLQSSITDLQTTAQSMKDEATTNLKSAEDDLSTFFETGGNPLNKKDTKYLGGSMSEEGQIRTGVREFLKKEFKNGRINLDETDAQRILQYSPMSEDDPILVFKKIYGDEAYNKAGSFPGAFDVGESYNHYESIFRSKMDGDLLKVKDKKYVGDGKLILSESDEIKVPIKDDDVPFAKGGIADLRKSFSLGGANKMRMGVMEIIKMIKTKMSPIGAMKEVNKVIGKKGPYKELRQDEIDEIIEKTEDFIFQKDPDDLYKGVEDMGEGTIDLDLVDKTIIDRPMFKQDSSTTNEIKEGVAEIMSDTSPAALEASIDIDNLMLKYPGMDKNLARQIATDTNPKRKADVIAMVEQTFELNKQGKSGDEIIDIFKKGTDRTEQAMGGRIGYYGGGITNMIEPDLSDIGHGGEAMNSRTRVMTPGSQATTSTGLNYLLGEDNDTTRVPYNEGNMVLPKAKPAQSPLVELSRIYKTYEDAMPGVSKDTQKYLQQDFIQKLNDAGISQEDFMTYRMQNNLADGGRAGYDQGGSSQPMGPEFSTNDPKEALKEIINRFIPIKDYGIPLLGNSQLMFNGLDNVQAGGQSDLFGGELNYGLKKSLKDDKFGLGFEFKKSFADGGRIGYVGGGGVNLARRGFLKLAGATVASVAALKTGLVKILGKTAATAVPKMVTIPAGSGAPAWFEGMVNKVLADGIDITKKASTLDGQVVKSLDTPTGKVDVTFDTRTGSIDAFYKGENTALGESVDMRYTVGQADEGTKIKPADEFEAVEAVPEMQGFNVDDTELAFGENVVSDVRGLYSDTSELAELGGQKVLIKDIAESIQKKRVLKDMNDDSMGFANEVLERTGIAADPPHDALTKIRYHSD